MPFIRYDLGDLVTGIRHENGLTHVKSIHGRINQYLMKQDGSLISQNNYTRYFKLRIGFEEISFLTTLQTSKKNLIIKILPKPNYNRSTDNKIITEIKKLLGKNVNIKIEHLKKIPGGKFYHVISKLTWKRK